MANRQGTAEARAKAQTHYRVRYCLSDRGPAMQPDIAFAILAGIIAAEVLVWALATKAAWRAVKRTILFAGFGVCSILGFLLVASRVQDTRIIAGLFITLCILSLWMAEAFRR